MTDTDHRNRINANDFKNDKYYGKWQEMNQFEKVCWHWNFINNLLFDNLHENKNYLLVKFEDLFIHDTEKTMRKIIDFFELNNELITDYNQLIEATKHKKNSTEKIIFDTIDEVIQLNINSYHNIISNETLKKFGY